MTEEAVRIGHALYESGDFLNPFQTLDTGVTAHTAPGFPVLVAGVYRVFGDGSHGAYALDVIEALVMVAGIALLPIVMQSLGVSFLTGILAGLIAALGIRRFPTWEANYVALLMMVTTLLAFRYCLAVRGKIGSSRFLSSPWSISLLQGFLWGAILLTGPSAASIWMTWLIFGGWLSWRTIFRYAWLPTLIVPLILIGPWEWRNYKVFHTMVPLRDSFGLELRISNNPCAKVSLWLNRHGVPCYEHPNEILAEAQKITSQGEIAYNAQQTREAVRWIAANPLRALALWAQRVEWFWFPGGWRLLAFVTINLATPVSLLGLLFLYRTNRTSAVLLASLLTVYPLVYYAIQSSDRYRIPILWVTYGLAATAITGLVNVGLVQFGSRKI